MNEVVDKYFRENYDLLVKRMKNRLNSLEDAEDVVQEAFTRALKYYESFNPSVSSFEIWFSRILTNAFKRFSSERRLGGLAKNLEDSLDEIEPILEDMVSKLTSKEVNKMISAKANGQEEVLLLNIKFGYNCKEISDLTGKSKRYIETILYRFANEVRMAYK